MRLYRYFNTHKKIFWVLLLFSFLLMGGVASRIQLEQDITKFFPDDKRVEKLNEWFKQSPFAERLVVMVSLKDSATAAQPDSLLMVADSVKTNLQQHAGQLIESITTTPDEDQILEVLQGIQNHLPVFLEESDYATLDSITKPEIIDQILQRNYRQLISPSGVAVKNIIINDPLGFSFLVLKKMQRLQYDEAFEIYDGYIVTKDHRHLLFFIQPNFRPNDAAKAKAFVQEVEKISMRAATQHEQILVSCFGAAVVASGNASQLQQDTILTVSLMVVLLIVALLGYFKKKRTPLLLLLPVLWGGLFAVCCIVLIKGSMSILALAVGAVILGVAIDYSLHYLVHLKFTGNNEQVVRDLVYPLLLGSGTTVLAFLSLQYVNAVVLRDIGLFAGLSLIGSALGTLLILPHLVGDKTFYKSPNQVSVPSGAFFKGQRLIVYCILIFTPVMLYFSGDVKFNNDMMSLNFMTSETQEAQTRLEKITGASLNTVYVVAEGKNIEQALRKQEQAAHLFQLLKQNQKIAKTSSSVSFLISDSLQKIRLNRWNSFWTPERKALVSAATHQSGNQLGFKPQVLAKVDTITNKEFKPYDSAVLKLISSSFFTHFVRQKENSVSLLTLVHVEPRNKKEVYAALSEAPVMALDRQQITNMLVAFVHEDFTFIVAATSAIVFFALLLAFGRIELTLITFVPMLFTWIWILGIMALLGIEFNIVNVMVSTFVFGLGDDYSIFTMDGLLQQYRAGKQSMASVRISILLSAITTICGLGVLIFAKHPALTSIAAIAIIGICCVFVMAQTIEPFLFDLLITRRVKKGKAPMTMVGVIFTCFTYGFFISGSIGLTIVGLVLKLIPVGKKSVRYFYHSLISGFTRTLVYLAIVLRKRKIDIYPNDFAKPGVIIANHSSFLDILTVTMLHPKLILLTNKWVYNSPVFGGVVRLADYYSVDDGAEKSVEQLHKMVAEGYSVVVFPEGTRSPDGKIGRFHKGAFYLAESLNLPIRPLLIHGASIGIPKGDFYLNKSLLTLKFLPLISPEDDTYGKTYSERTKAISRYFKQEFQKLDNTLRTPDFYESLLITNYMYKGPVLEWYMRVKLKLEKNYAPFEALIPKQARILDLGCGYGFLCYLLQCMSNERTITGVDYDEDKIVIAQHGYLKTERLHFVHADVMKYEIQQEYDVIIISDVLHYLPAAWQHTLLLRCVKALSATGRLIIRDGDADLKKRHKGTKLTEIFSTRIFGFNKSEHELTFLSGQSIRDLARECNLSLVQMDDTTFTSNVIFVLDKKGEPGV